MESTPLGAMWFWPSPFWQYSGAVPCCSRIRGTFSWVRLDEFLGTAPLVCGAPCQWCCSFRPSWDPLLSFGQGPYAPPNPVLSAMLPGSINRLLGEMARKSGKSQPRVKVCEGIGLLPGGNSKGRASFCAAPWRGVCISPWITRKSWSKIGNAGNSTRNHEISQFGA